MRRRFAHRCVTMLKRPVNTDDIIALTRELCQFETGVVTEGNTRLFERLQNELPFDVTWVPSGSMHNGWTVADSWKVDHALLKKDGKVVFDGRAHPLGVGMHSNSFSGLLSREELEPYLVTNPDLPEAYMFHSMWHIRPWAAEWRLCIPYTIYETLGPGNYEVDLRTTWTPGAMPIGVYNHQGETDETIVFNTDICHPTQANDGFCAVAMLVRFFQQLRGRRTRYSYRLVLAPEHLGTVFHTKDMTAAEIARLRACVFMEMPGTGAPIVATSSFLGGQPIDRAVKLAMQSAGVAHKLSGWREGCGNDEIVWEAPGVEVPTIEMTRAETPNFPYREYHSNLDNPDLMSPEKLAEVFEVLETLIDVIEDDARIHRHFDGLICLSHPDYDLYLERHDPTVDKGLTDDDEKWGHLLNFLFRYFDGSMTISEIADKHDVDFRRLRRYLERFAEKGLVSLVPEIMPRPEVTKPALRGGGA